MKKIKISNRNTASVDTIDYCYLANIGDFIELTQWTNKDGYDLEIRHNQVLNPHDEPIRIQLTVGQLEAITKLFKTLEKDGN